MTAEHVTAQVRGGQDDPANLSRYATVQQPRRRAYVNEERRGAKQTRIGGRGLGTRGPRSTRHGSRLVDGSTENRGVGNACPAQSRGAASEADRGELGRATARRLQGEAAEVADREAVERRGRTAGAPWKLPIAAWWYEQQIEPDVVARYVRLAIEKPQTLRYQHSKRCSTLTPAAMLPAPGGRTRGGHAECWPEPVSVLTRRKDGSVLLVGRPRSAVRISAVSRATD